MLLLKKDSHNHIIRQQDMNWIVSMAIIMIVFLLSGQIAKADDPAPKIRMKDGKILDEYLPYSRKFFVEGDAELNGKPVDAISITIEYKGIKYATGIWFRPEGSVGSVKFSIFFDRPLKFGEHNNLITYYCSKYKPRDGDTRKVVEAALDEIRQIRAKGGEMNGESVRQSLSSAIKAEVGPKIGVMVFDPKKGPEFI